MNRTLVALALVAGFTGTAAAQTFNPPPVRSAVPTEKAHKIGVDLGWGMSSGLELDFGGGDVDLDYQVMPTVNLNYQYGLNEKIGVGGHIFYGKWNFDESGFDDESAWTLDLAASYTAIKDPKWALAPFLALGITDEMGPHFALGVIADFSAMDKLKISPYVQYGYGVYDDNDADLTVSGLRLGANAVYTIQPNLEFVSDLAFEQQTWDLTPDGGSGTDGSGLGFSFSVGVQFTLAPK